jgi:hypothetical protein
MAKLSAIADRWAHDILGPPGPLWSARIASAGKSWLNFGEFVQRIADQAAVGDVIAYARAA